MTSRPAFQQTQYRFAAHIRDPERHPGPEGIEDRRMKIYRDLIYNNIESFVASGFPVLRSLMNDADWHLMMRDFVSRHQSHTPYFLEISEEFLRYLQEECDCLPKLPFVVELAHYEWVELALDVSPEEIPANLGRNGDLMTDRPLVSPLAWRLSYQFPVHRISPAYQPLSPPEQPTYIVVYRNRDDQVKFLEANAVTVRLLQLLDDGADMTGEAALRQIAAELGGDNAEAVLAFGEQTLVQLWQLDILVGFAHRE